MRIFVCEYVAGGGVAGSPLRAEGWAMLAALLADFTATGQHEVITCLSAPPATRAKGQGARGKGQGEGGSALSLPLVACDVVPVPTPADFRPVFRSILQQADAALVVAPETGGILADLTEDVERSGRLRLGSSSSAVRIAGDKAVCAERWLGQGVPTPRTIAVMSPAAAVAAADSLGFPLVVKPIDGAGAASTYQVRGAEELASRLPLAIGESGSGVAVLQRWVEGVAASVSLLVGNGRAVPLSLNAQHIAVAEDGEITYHGGTVPLVHPDRDRAFAVACAAADAIAGLRGYVGVDLVLAESGPVCIELNPRVTTAYVGLRRVVRESLAGALLRCTLQGHPGPLPDLVGTVHFDKAGVRWAS